MRWGTPYPVGDMLGAFLSEIVRTPLVYKKLIGMQVLLEGLAMGAFANLHAHTNDRLLKRLVQLVMTDEAFHHKFGKIWADRTLPKLSRDEHERVEDWTAQVFEMPLSRARLRCPTSWRSRPKAMRVATTMRLRSRFDRPGRSQTSPKSHFSL